MVDYKYINMNFIISESSEIKIDAKDFEYTIHDLPRLKIMKKIVNDLDTFHISLEPYFKDYEEV